MQTEAGEDTSQLQQDLAAAETALDRCLLKLFNMALRADKLQQALEVACQLHQQKALEGAIQLANHNRQPALSDRIATFLQNRLDLEAAEAEQVQPLAALAYRHCSVSQAKVLELVLCSIKSLYPALSDCMATFLQTRVDLQAAETEELHAVVACSHCCMS